MASGSALCVFFVTEKLFQPHGIKLKITPIFIPLMLTLTCA